MSQRLHCGVTVRSFTAASLMHEMDRPLQWPQRELLFWARKTVKGVSTMVYAVLTGVDPSADPRAIHGWRRNNSSPLS